MGGRASNLTRQAGELRRLSPGEVVEDGFVAQLPEAGTGRGGGDDALGRGAWTVPGGQEVRWDRIR